MKKITFFLATIALLSACKSTTNEGDSETPSHSDSTAVEASTESLENHYYGDTISEDGAIAVADLMSVMNGKDSVEVKLSGNVNSSCQKKGCWMKMDMGDGQELRVNFRDYSFFVPKNLNGEFAVVEGKAYVDTLDVPYLRHLAEDAGKSPEEIEGITEPEISLNFTANGVIIKS